MRSIIDTLFLDTCELDLIKRKFPDAIIASHSNSDRNIKHYRVIIPSENWNEDYYYLFLIENEIAMSSDIFCSRVENDQIFARRMSTKVGNLVVPLIV